MRKKWTVAAYDPNGTFVDTIGRTFWTRKGAKREERKYRLNGLATALMVPNRDGIQVPLTNYRVCEVSEAGGNIVLWRYP